MFTCFSNIIKFFFFLQNWGDYTDMSQAVLAYDLYTIDVLLICWFGTQLTQHVRENDMKYYDILFKSLNAQM
jgi:hypothetical protein